MQFKEYSNAFDLLKVYGAGWLREAGTAFGKNAAFLPNGAVYKRIFDAEDGGGTFGVGDLYAAYRLQRAADGYKFGRGAIESRRQTRFLFYMIALELLREIIMLASMTPCRAVLTQSLLKLFASDNEDIADGLLNAAVGAVDS